MNRVKTWIARWPRLAALIVMLLAMSVPLLAQAIVKLTDGTFAEKVIIYSLAGTEQGGLLTTISDTLTSIRNAMATDATMGNTATSNGPQLMAECDDTSTVAGGEGQAARLRLNCTNRALLVENRTDPCQDSTLTKTTTAFSQTAIANIITASASAKNYVCAMSLVASAAEVVSVVEDDTTACASPTAALTGSTTAANGQSLAANGGFVLGDGSATVLAGTAANRYLCVLQSGANRVSGFITWVQR